MAILEKSLWDNEFLGERRMSNFNDTSSSASQVWYKPDNIYSPRKPIKKWKEEKRPNIEPQFFDPKDLDIDES